MTGGTDILISNAPIDDMAIYGTAFVIELKRVVKSSSVPQAIAELISADAKTDDANRI